MAPTESKGKIAIVGGTSLFSSSFFSHLEATSVPTEHGSAIVHVDPNPEGRLVFVQRHHADADAGAQTYFPPHRINHRAIFAALSKLSVQFIVAVCSVGSVDEELPPGNLVIPDDYFQLFGPPISFYDDNRGHIVPGFNEELRACIIDTLTTAQIPQLLSTKGTYIQTVGPRFETKAEIKFLSANKIGHIVGMTGASEATMAKELGMPYAILSMIDNMANGMEKHALTYDQFKAGVAKNQPVVEKCIKLIVDALLKKL